MMSGFSFKNGVNQVNQLKLLVSQQPVVSGSNILISLSIEIVKAF